MIDGGVDSLRGDDLSHRVDMGSLHGRVGSLGIGFRSLDGRVGSGSGSCCAGMAGTLIALGSGTGDGS
jgi:hypothetical protein